MTKLEASPSPLEPYHLHLVLICRPIDFTNKGDKIEHERGNLLKIMFLFGRSGDGLFERIAMIHPDFRQRKHRNNTESTAHNHILEPTHS